MTVRDMLDMDIDVDCYDDVFDDIGIAFCGPVALTSDGYEKFVEVLHYPVKLDLANKEATICIDDKSDAVCIRRLKKAKELFYALAGYCADEDWNRWFEDCAQAYEDIYGVTRCGSCNNEIRCTECGDMPELCPKCKVRLSYSYLTEQIYTHHRFSQKKGENL